MAGPVEHRRIDPRRLGEPIKWKVPGQRVRPFVAEHDGPRTAFPAEVTSPEQFRASKKPE